MLEWSGASFLLGVPEKVGGWFGGYHQGLSGLIFTLLGRCRVEEQGSPSLRGEHGALSVMVRWCELLHSTTAPHVSSGYNDPTCGWSTRRLLGSHVTVPEVITKSLCARWKVQCMLIGLLGNPMAYVRQHMTCTADLFNQYFGSRSRRFRLP